MVGDAEGVGLGLAVTIVGSFTGGVAVIVTGLAVVVVAIVDVLDGIDGTCPQPLNKTSTIKYFIKFLLRYRLGYRVIHLLGLMCRIFITPISGRGLSNWKAVRKLYNHQNCCDHL